MKRKFTVMFFFHCLLLFFTAGLSVYAVEMGDVDDNSDINIIDALQTAQYVTGAEPAGFNPDVSDVTDDGTTDIIDSLVIAQYAVKIIDDFPANKCYRYYLRLLKEGKKKWDSLQVSYYEYEYMQYCFCINAGIPFSVQVRDGTIISVVNKTDGMPVPESQYQYFHTIEDLFDIVSRAIDQKKKITNLAFHDIYGYPTRISIDYIPMAIDDEMTYLAADFRPLPAVVLTDKPGSELQQDPFSLIDAAVTGDILSLTLRCSGGCVPHDYTLYARKGFMESYPVQVNVYLAHDDNEDMCDAIITHTPAFDLKPLKEIYEEMYGQKDPIILRIHNYFVNEPGKFISLLYNPL